MAKEDLNRLIAEIPGEEWESTLSIGNFKGTEQLRVFTRPFSYISRTRISGDQGDRIVYVKLYRNRSNRTHERCMEKIVEDYRVARFWYDKFADSQQYQVVRPTMVIPEKYLFVTEESKGENLFNLILKNAKWMPSSANMDMLCKHLRNVGGWLGYKKTIMTDPADRYNLMDLKEYMDVRLKILLETPTIGIDEVYRKRILDFVDESVEQIPNSDLLMSTSHSDFNPGNILVNDATVTVLDFGRLVKECFLLDASKLHFQLWLLTLKPIYRPGTIRHLQSALWEGFGDPGIEQRMIFRLIMIRNILTHLTGQSKFKNLSFKEKSYNRWVIHREMKLLMQLLNSGNLSN